MPLNDDISWVGWPIVSTHTGDCLAAAASPQSAAIKDETYHTFGILTSLFNSHAWAGTVASGFQSWADHSMQHNILRPKLPDYEAPLTD